MKTISSGLATHLAGEVLTLATCWLVTRRDGVVSGYTDHDRDLTVEGVLCQAMTGYTRSAIQTSVQLAVDQLDLEGVLDDAGITDEDLQAGRYDHAEIRILTVNWADLSQGVLRERQGWLGEVTTKRGVYVAELRGLTQALSRGIVEITTPDCRADLYDARCGVDPTLFTVESTVTAGGERQSFGDSARSEPAQWFQYGSVSFLSGANQGLSFEVKAYEPGAFGLWLPAPFDVAAGDQYRARAGCDKQLSTCIAKFNNVANFRGEPFIPGTDFLLMAPDAKAGTVSGGGKK